MKNLVLKKRPRRLRQSAQIREMVAETDLQARHFVLPLFLTDEKKDSPIKTLSGFSRQTIDSILKVSEKALKLGIPAVALFPHIHENWHGALCQPRYWCCKKPLQPRHLGRKRGSPTGR